MSVRVQVILEEEERATFQDQARRESMSLSAWLREAGLERLRGQQQTRFNTDEELEAFFRQCDETEGPGREPDWDTQLEVIDAARRDGNEPT